MHNKYGIRIEVDLHIYFAYRTNAIKYNHEIANSTLTENSNEFTTTGTLHERVWQYNFVRMSCLSLSVTDLQI